MMLHYRRGDDLTKLAARVGGTRLNKTAWSSSKSIIIHTCYLADLIFF